MAVVSGVIEHGGNITNASRSYGIPVADWQDLSTGISPWRWPVPTIPSKIWGQLPDTSALLQAAQTYYQVDCKHIVATAGSQQAIRFIPSALPQSTVAIPLLGYQEHRYSWQLAGHTVVNYQNFDELQALLTERRAQHAVVINPNNPTTDVFSKESLLQLLSGLGKQRLLLVDEAFADVDSSQSLLPYSHLQGLIVLRSVGKFFGLAGIRLGFAVGTHPVLEQLKTAASPWGVNGPAAYAGAVALADKQWQQTQRLRITAVSETLLQLLRQRFAPFTVRNGGLFVTVFGPKRILQHAFEQAARQGVLLRYDNGNANDAWLRVGLANDNFQRLAQINFGENNAL